MGCLYNEDVYAPPDRHTQERVQRAVSVWNYFILLLKWTDIHHEFIRISIHNTYYDHFNFQLYNAYLVYIDKVLKRAAFNVVVAWKRVFDEDWSWESLLERSIEVVRSLWKLYLTHTTYGVSVPGDKDHHVVTKPLACLGEQTERISSQPLCICIMVNALCEWNFKSFFYSYSYHSLIQTFQSRQVKSRTQNKHKSQQTMTLSGHTITPDRFGSIRIISHPQLETQGQNLQNMERSQRSYLDPGRAYGSDPALWHSSWPGDQVLYRHLAPRMAESRL